MIIFAAATGISLLVVALAGLRILDVTADNAVRSQLRGLATKRVNFDTSMVDHLPEPARRYFCYAIRPGARIFTVAEITIAGEIGFGNREAPSYQPMRAQQVLAPPYGLLWQMSAGRGLTTVFGSDAIVDGRSWSRFWLLGVIPIARAGKNADHLRSSFGRVVAEAAIWTPAALLPQFGVRWSVVDANTARATVEHAGLIQTVDVHVAGDGRSDVRSHASLEQCQFRGGLAPTAIRRHTR